MKILVTGGTVFVSKYVTNYFSKNNEVYVLNRNTKKQLEGVSVIEGDRHIFTDLCKMFIANHLFSNVRCQIARFIFRRAEG